MNKPKLLISVIPICSTTDTIFIGKRVEDLKLNVVSGKLKYSEEFDEAASRLLVEELGLNITSKERFNFICTYNIVDKDIGIHFVGVMYYVLLDKEETEKIVINKFTFSSFVFATIDDILNFKEEFFLSFSIFLSKYSIKNINDIKLLVSS